jgi:hypothetical protein
MFLLIAAMGCSRAAANLAGPNPTYSNPGPKPTVTDPGPRPTIGGPVTLRGVLRAGTGGCIALAELPDGILHELVMPGGYALDAQKLRWNGRPIGHTGDTLYVAGHDLSQPGGCGRRFAVEHVVSIRPGN